MAESTIRRIIDSGSIEFVNRIQVPLDVRKRAAVILSGESSSTPPESQKRCRATALERGGAEL